MKKITIAVLMAFIGIITAFCDDSTDLAARKAKAHARREKMLYATGGRIVKPGSQQGKIRFVSAVKEVDATILGKQYASFMRAYPFDIATVSGEPVTVETADAAKKQLGVALAVFIVNAPFSAPMIAAPEEGWAIVNYRVCATPDRAAKQAVKAFAIIAGAANSAYGVTFLSSTRPQELDSIAVVEFPLDVAECIRKQLAIIRVTPKVISTYRTACQEGWAPAPTNEYQKAVWEKAHSEKERGPTNPIKILPPKK